jgi:hypothetical protein
MDEDRWKILVERVEKEVRRSRGHEKFLMPFLESYYPLCTALMSQFQLMSKSNDVSKMGLSVGCGRFGSRGSA